MVRYILSLEFTGNKNFKAVFIEIKDFGPFDSIFLEF